VRYQRSVDLVELTGILQTTAAGLSIDEIAMRFEVSRRTAERMLSALRRRFPGLEPIFRGGRKYWKLPADGRSQPLQLPRTLETLTERIAELEAEIVESRNETEEIRGIAQGVLATSPIGLVVLDARFRVVWSNDAFSRYVGMTSEELIDRDMRTLVRERLRHVFAESDHFAEQVISSYDTNHYIKRLECHVLPEGARAGRRLEHGSRPITTGRYKGGRVDHYVDVGARAREAAALAATPTEQALSVPEVADPAPGRAEDIGPMLRAHREILKETAAAALAADDVPERLARRLASIVHANLHSVEASLEVLDRSGIKSEFMVPSTTLETVASILRPYAEERGVALTVEASPSLPSMLGGRALVISNLTTAGKLTIEALDAGSTIALRAECFENPLRIRISLEDDAVMPDGFTGIDGQFFETQKGGVGLGVVLVRDDDGRPSGGLCQYFEIPARYPQT
jgi:PAS domain-containing protein